MKCDIQKVTLQGLREQGKNQVCFKLHKLEMLGDYGGRRTKGNCFENKMF